MTTRIVVAQKPPRGSGIAHPTLEGFKRYDVTSGSNQKVNGLAVRNLSPLLIETEYSVSDLTTNTSNSSKVILENL